MSASTDIEPGARQAPRPEPPVDRKGAQTWYDVLEVSPRASEVVIQAAYRALARERHPDLNDHGSAAERMRELNRARDVLMDPRKRTIYDLNIGQHKAPLATGGRLATSVRRAHTCWRCERTISAYAAYCGRCRWLVCEDCQGCGCQRPDWQPSTSSPPYDPLLERIGPLSGVGWIVVASLTAVIILTLITIWAVALR